MQAMQFMSQLSLSITASLFHSRLRTYLFYKSFRRRSSTLQLRL